MMHLGNGDMENTHDYAVGFVLSSPFLSQAIPIMGPFLG